MFSFMETYPAGNIWDPQENKIVLICLADFERTGSTGVNQRKIGRIVGRRGLRNYRACIDNLVGAGVLAGQDGFNELYVFDPQKAVAYLEAKGIDAEEVLKQHA